MFASLGPKHLQPLHAAAGRSGEPQEGVLLHAAAQDFDLQCHAAAQGFDLDGWVDRFPKATERANHVLMALVVRWMAKGGYLGTG